MGCEQDACALLPTFSLSGGQTAEAPAHFLGEIEALGTVTVDDKHAAPPTLPNEVADDASE
jgi:hypothetical protein